MNRLLPLLVLLFFNGCFNHDPIEDNTIVTIIYFENGTCKCPDAAIGFTEVLNGIEYTVVDNTTIRTEIANGNVNLCTTFVTDMSELF